MPSITLHIYIHTIYTNQFSDFIPQNPYNYILFTFNKSLLYPLPPLTTKFVSHDQVCSYTLNFGPISLFCPMQRLIITFFLHSTSYCFTPSPHLQCWDWTTCSNACSGSWLCFGKETMSKSQHCRWGEGEGGQWFLWSGKNILSKIVSKNPYIAERTYFEHVSIVGTTYLRANYKTNIDMINIVKSVFIIVTGFWGESTLSEPRSRGWGLFFV